MSCVVRIRHSRLICILQNLRRLFAPGDKTVPCILQWYQIILLDSKLWFFHNDNATVPFFSRIAVLHNLHAAYCYRPSSVVCPLVCRSVTLVSPAKTAEPIEMLFRLWTRMGPGNHVLEGVQIPTRKGAILRGEGAPHCKV